ncbi:MAG: hypothetical protein MI717_15735 [Spirochaetales bacterium]|nr:hypothetical protein [Spirochaetales bacterium]
MNHKFLFFFLLGTSMLFASCATQYGGDIYVDGELDLSKPMLGFYCSGFNHDLIFVNLDDSQEKKVLRFKAGSSPSLCTLPEGRWGLEQIQGTTHGYQSTTKYYVSIPYEMMTVIEAKPGTIVFLGQIKYDESEEKDFWGRSDTIISYQQPFDDFLDYLDFDAKFDSSAFDVVPLKRMPLAL